MVAISSPLPHLPTDIVSLYSATDPLLFDLPVLVFHGPSTTVNSSLNSARMQAHVVTLAGLQSHPRITSSPNGPLYDAVKHLPREQQGDSVGRGLAIGLLKYFTSLPQTLKDAIRASPASALRKTGNRVASLFDARHAGELAGRMVKITSDKDVKAITTHLQAAFAERAISSIDVDVTLPPDTIGRMTDDGSTEVDQAEGEEDLPLKAYGRYAPLIKALGPSTFLPTTRIRRAPSRPKSLNRSKSFVRSQKESLRRELSEFVETEDRYVAKLHTLVTHVADHYRDRARGKQAQSASPGQDALRTLFPPSLDDILYVNTQFLEELRAVLKDTEDTAQADINSQELDPHASNGRAVIHGDGREDTGALAFAKLFLHWFPSFAQCYADYLRASSDFSRVLASFTKDPTSTFTQRVRQTGEQRLKSMLIEPVQRLPRYTLFIDNIVNLLPVAHPALTPLLRARDLITDICALDSLSAKDPRQLVTRLRTLISPWPQGLQPQGRIIAAADFAELRPPFRFDPTVAPKSTGVVLLFADVVVFARKSSDASLSARGLMAEIDRPSAEAMTASITAANSGQAFSKRLVFTQTLPLTLVRFSESTDGRIVWMTSTHDAPSSETDGQQAVRGEAGMRAFRLGGPYEDKASRWSEDVAKARIEGRYSEPERESGKWEMRSTNGGGSSLRIFASISENPGGTAMLHRGPPALIQIVVDEPRSHGDVVVGERGVEVLMRIFTLGGNRYQLHTRIITGDVSVDEVFEDDLPQVLLKRLGESIVTQNQPHNPALVRSFMLFNQDFLLSLDLQKRERTLKETAARPSSPVKMLTNFFAGGSMKESMIPAKQRTPIMGNIPKILPLVRKPSRPDIQNASALQAVADKVGKLAQQGSLVTQMDSPRSLEDTMTTYITAIHERRGHIEGRMLRNRAAADELTTNDVYNAFLEDPTKHENCADIPLDVLFAAFEKFLRRAWTDRMDAVIDQPTLNMILAKSETLSASNFEEYFRLIMSELAPPNRRAFRTILALLASLLDGAQHDGDRGSLTATFAEMLVPKGGSHAYIPLLDRLVQDLDRIFDEYTPANTTGRGTPMTGSINSTLRGARPIQAGSVSSNTSSLRKRLGLSTQSREQHRPESESKAGSVWRTLSKSSRGQTYAETGSISMSKASLLRTKSTDRDPRLVATQRPISHDRPSVFNAFSQRPGSAHADAPSSALGTLPVMTAPGSVARRHKRRSSLSDLQSLRQASGSLPMPALPLTQPKTAETVARPTTPEEVGPTELKSAKIRRPATPKTPSPVKKFVIAGRSSPVRKENAASPRSTLTERPTNVQGEEVLIAEHRSVRKAVGAGSGIPTLKGNLSTPSTLRKKEASPQRPSPRKASSMAERLNEVTEELRRVKAENARLKEEVEELRSLRA
ncbi:MAG: hypothetical protein M1838_001038 [Thelocarpon superellum]|nr:MAG: hypothetical protein M1838_001038 [Thelocarpon superellum]